MQTTTSLNSSEVARKARVVRIWRSPARNRLHRRRVVASAAMHKPPSRWTVVAAFIFAVVLHAGAVMWVEVQQEKPPLEVDAPVPIDSEEKMTFEMGAGSRPADAVGERTAVD